MSLFNFVFSQDRAFYEIKYHRPVIQVLKGTRSRCYYWGLLDIILRIKKGPLAGPKLSSQALFT